MSRMLILTAGFGEGHNAAARNLQAAAQQLWGREAAVTADLFALASPRLNGVSRRAYLKVINHSPKVWSSFYRWVDHSQVFPRHLWLLRKELRAFERLLLQHRPEAVCSTYPVYGFMADVLRTRGVLTCPFHNVVTDSISINSLWTRPHCDGWFVPNAETGDAVRRLGVGIHRIHDLGFPVQPFFSQEGRDYAPPAPAVSGWRPRVLYILNSGVKGAEETAALLVRSTDWEFTFAVGRDEGLYHRIKRHTAGRTSPTTLLRWTDQIPLLLSTHHAVISKAGGATTQEAIAARCPMIVNQIVPGQEEGNYELLRQRGIGALAETPETVLGALQGAFRDNASLWHEWRRRLESLARPHSAFDICGRILDPRHNAPVSSASEGTFA